MVKLQRREGAAAVAREGAEPVGVALAVAGIGRCVTGSSALGRRLLPGVSPQVAWSVERAVNDWLVTRRRSRADQVTWALSTYADTAPTIGAALAYGVALQARASARAGEASRPGDAPRALPVGLQPIAAAALETAVFMSAAALVGRARPDVLWLDRPAPTSSFPSGHTAASTAVHVTVARLAWGRRQPGESARVSAARAAVAYGIPAAVGFSRVYRGMHHPSDVIVGWALGAWAAHTVARWHAALRRREQGAAAGAEGVACVAGAAC